MGMEETGEYLFNEEVMVGDAVKICVRAPKNRIEAKAFLNYFADPRDTEGDVITEPSKLAYVVYSKTNMDGVAFDASNGGLKVVDGDPANEKEIKKDDANAKRKAGEAEFAENDYVGRVVSLVIADKKLSSDLYYVLKDSKKYSYDETNMLKDVKYSREQDAGTRSIMLTQTRHLNFLTISTMKTLRSTKTL